jgi:DNA-binding ferritin-like protein (Dps family)
MKRNIIILQEMYKTVSMGINGINDIKGKIKSEKLRISILDAKKKYQRYRRKIISIIKEYNTKPNDINVFIKITNSLWTDMNLMNSNDGEIVGMLIEGTNKGIIKFQEIKNNEGITDKKISKLLNKLLELFEYQTTEWRQYL